MSLAPLFLSSTRETGTGSAGGKCYSSRPSCRRTTRSILAASRSLWVATSAALPFSTPPAHALTIFFPMVDLTEHNGATEFALGTHRKHHEHVVDGMSTSSATERAIYAHAGDCIVFDYRCWHRGLANASEHDRQVMGAVGQQFGARILTLTLNSQLQLQALSTSQLKRQLKKLKLKANDCLAIEDTQESLNSAKRAKIKCIIFPGKFHSSRKFSGAYKKVYRLNKNIILR